MEEDYMCFESDFKRDENDLEMVSSNFQCRHQTDISIIESLRREIDDQRNILEDKKE
jgi:hypothetical protein